MDRVKVLVGDVAQEVWESYDVDSDLLTPADSWSVELGSSNGELPGGIFPGASVRVTVGDEPVMVGFIDDVDHVLDKHGHRFRLAGRDQASVLLDCSAPILNLRVVSLQDIAIKVLRPLGIRDVRINADNTRIRQKISVEPGDTAWSVLANVAEANGLWAWFDPSGAFVIGGPDYSRPEVASLVIRKSGGGNNVLSIFERQSIVGRYSEITVLGQSPGGIPSGGQSGLHATATDQGMRVYRPRVVSDYECDSVAVCYDRARKLVADGRLEGYTLTITVKGHRIDSPNMPGHGMLWTPGQRVHVVSETHRIDGTYFLMARRMTGGRGQPTVTTLTLKEDGVWIIDAHPHKRLHRRGVTDQFLGGAYGNSN